MLKRFGKNKKLSALAGCSWNRRSNIVTYFSLDRSGGLSFNVALSKATP